MLTGQRARTNREDSFGAPLQVPWLIFYLSGSRAPNDVNGSDYLHLGALPRPLPATRWPAARLPQPPG
ncbi:hypothetical protein FAGKG844_10214 [Frankia sp. AgKG'84/4]